MGIPGSSLLKKNKILKDKVLISTGRMPPSIEKIIELKPDLVIGSKGFLDYLNESHGLQIQAPMPICLLSTHDGLFQQVDDTAQDSFFLLIAGCWLYQLFVLLLL